MATSNSITLHIMDKEYVLACPPEAQAELREAARSLDQTMRDIRRGGKVYGTERIAVMAAINLAYDLRQKSRMDEQSDVALGQIIERADRTLANS